MWIGGFKYNSLIFKTSLVIACAVSLILMAESYVITQTSIRAVEDQLKDRAMDAATNLRDYLLSPEAQQRNQMTDSVELDDFIHHLMKDQKDFVKIAVYALAGGQRRHIAGEENFEFRLDEGLYEQAVREKRTLKKSLPIHEDGRGWVVVAPVVTPQEVSIGVISVTISLADADHLAGRQAKWAIWSAGLAIIFLTVVLIHYLNRAVSAPIRELVAAMERVKGGDLKTTARVRTGDEIGEMADNFNAMVAKLREEDERIANFNKELQVRIAEAVRELNQRNQDLEQLTENLFETQKELSRLETTASMGQLASSVAHEIGTPLHSISGHVQLLLERPSLPADVQEKLNIIRAQIGRLTEIISRTLSSTELPSPEFEPVEVNAVVKEIISLTQPGLRKRGIDLGTHLAADLPAVCADQNQLQQVFLNLLTNAAEAMPGGGRLQVATGVWGSPPGAAAGPGGNGSYGPGGVSITFEDTGVGIAPQDLRNIFKPFFSTKNNRKSAGLGLAICRAIIKHHKGEIEVSSEAGRGTRFTVRLPAMAGGLVV